MSKWTGWVITNKGLELEAKVNTGKCKLVFTRIALGDGMPTELEEVTDLVHQRVSASVTDLNIIDDNVCSIEASFINTELTSDLINTEMGLFATDPDDGEILYGITTDSEPDTIPAAGGSAAYEQIMKINLMVANTSNVAIDVDSTSLVTKSYCDNAIRKFIYGGTDIDTFNWMSVSSANELLEELEGE